MDEEWRPSRILQPKTSTEVIVNGFQRAKTVKIPKIIMQTWKTKDVPKKWKASERSIKKFMPDWDYHLMTDEDNLVFVERYFPDFLHHFKTFEYPIQRADAIRYMWLYVMGGIYFDLDLELLKPLDDLFYEDGDLYVVKSVHVEVYTNAFMAAKPRLQVMLQCMEGMKSPYTSLYIGKHLKVVNSTGPNMFSRAVNKIKEECVLKELEAGVSGDPLKKKYQFEVKELPAHLIVACSVCDPKPCCSEGGYCRTLGGSSWGAEDGSPSVFIFCNRYYFFSGLLLILVIIAIVIAYRRQKKRRLGSLAL